MPQAVSMKHPLADEFLKRDLNNINSCFKKIGIQSLFREAIRMLLEGRQHKQFWELSLKERGDGLE
jgi:serine/threonine-protein kinase RIO1